MVNFVIDNASSMGNQPVTTTSTVQRHPLGLIVGGHDQDGTLGGAEFIYLKGVASTVVGSLVNYDQFLATTTLNPVTGGIGPVAVSMSINVANQYGWYQIAGTAAALAPNAMVAGADVFALAATAASVDDAVVNGEQVIGAVVSTTTGTPSTGLGYIQINRPHMQGRIL